MLDSKDKQKIEEYIDKLIRDIHADIVETYIGSKKQKNRLLTRLPELRLIFLHQKVK